MIPFSALGSGERSNPAKANILEVQTISVKGQDTAAAGRSQVRLGLAPEDIFVRFGFTPVAGRRPIRLCSKLDGYDKDWDEGGGMMFLVTRFYSETGDIVASNEFRVSGESAGWRNDLSKSSLTHRREMLIAPPRAAHLLVVMTSAGPQTTEGVFVVSDLNVFQLSPDGSQKTLLQFPGNKAAPNVSLESTMANWVRDGTSPSMAKIVELGPGLSTKALEIQDDNPLGHAEWHNNLESAPNIHGGDQLVLEWNEMYSIGDSAMHFGAYRRLDPGSYLFHAREVDLLGCPTGVETSVTLVVPKPFWQTLWFWGLIASIGATALLTTWRYVVRLHTRRAIQKLERQSMLEQERLRIARDIHDDLGARVTQISLVSAMAQNETNDSQKMRAELEHISQMSRDLVTALYETVWTVNPENDNLSELGNYLFQIVNDLCEQGQCRCRSHIDELPHETIVSSHVRHNLCMVVKEAMHNVLKHARATEVKFQISFTQQLLTIMIQDNGCGFDPSNIPDPGHGLINMKKRVADIGGECRLESQERTATTLWIYLKINPPSA